MVGRVGQAIIALKAALDELDKTMHTLSIEHNRHGLRVHVYGPRDLQQVPGKEKEFVRDEGGGDYPIRHFKYYQGAEFFYLTNREDTGV